MSYHAEFSPSSAHRWISCPGSVAMSRGIPNTTSVYADEGTKAHEYGAWLLNGMPLPVPMVEREMVEYVSVYTNEIRRVAEGKILLIEQKLDISAITGEAGASGTADAIIIDEDNHIIEVHDLKYGMGHIVDAEQNEQLMMYGLAAMFLVEDLFCSVGLVKLVIHQPRRDHLSEWTVTKEQLLEFGVEAGRMAKVARACEKGTKLYPSASACLWCPAKASCPALSKMVQSTAFDDFENLDEGQAPAPKKIDAENLPVPDVLDMIDDWVKAVRALVSERLNQGVPVAGWKLVAGKKGSRAWKDVTAAENLARALRLKVDEMYDKELKSPTQLEKVVPAKKWEQFKALIGQADAKPTVTSEKDKRPALDTKPVADTFDNLDNLEDLL